MEMINIYMNNWAKIWVKLKPVCFLGRITLYPVELRNCGKIDKEVGTRPEWLNCENDDLDVMLQMDSYYNWYSNLGTVEAWAMSYGVGPNEPILMYVKEPYWHRCGGEEVEYDAEYEAKLLKKTFDFHHRAYQFTKYLRRKDRIIRVREKRQEAFDKFCRESIEEMYIRRDTYGEFRPYGPPAGISYTLCSNVEPDKKYFLHPSIRVEGRSDSGNDEEAFEEMVKNSLKLYPNLTDKDIRKMPIKR